MCFEEWNPETHPEFYCFGEMGAMRLLSIAATMALMIVQLI
jgi:hypothetical protein